MRTPWLVLCCLLLPAPAAATSALWGEAGELWDPAGRLPDWAEVGYRGGLEPPALPVALEAADFGLVGDGVTDDSAALQAALDAAAQLGGGVVLLPPGRFRIEQIVTIEHSGVVLRGAGADEAVGTTLFFPHSLTDLRGPAQQWSWEGGMLWIGEGESIAGSAHGVAHGGGEVVITADAQRGDERLEVEDSAGLAGGDVVILAQDEDAEGSLGWHLHADQAPAGDCDWQANYGLSTAHRLAGVEQDALLLERPLRHDVRASWDPRVYRDGWIEEVGVEGIRFEMLEQPTPEHLEEPGWNAIYFDRGVRDSWVRDVVFVHVDNGIQMRGGTGWLTLERLGFEGRAGHHGLEVSFGHQILVRDLTFQSDFRHEVTISHRASGTVFRDLRSPHTIELDHHRDASFETLFEGIETRASFFSGGSWCAGSFSGARAVYWGLADPESGVPWAPLTATMVGSTLPVDEEQSDWAAWYELSDPLVPGSLHDSQRARAAMLADDGVFDEDPELGQRSAWQMEEPGRWGILRGEGEAALFLATTHYPARALEGGQAPGALARWVGTPEQGEDGYRFEASLRLPGDPAHQPGADAVLVVDQTEEGQLFAVFGLDPDQSGLFREQGGRIERLAPAADVEALAQPGWHRAALVRRLDRVEMWFDDVLLATAEGLEPPTGGVALGSLDDAVLFDAPRLLPQAAAIEDPPTEQPEPQGCSGCALTARGGRGTPLPGWSLWLGALWWGVRSRKRAGSGRQATSTK